MDKVTFQGIVFTDKMVEELTHLQEPGNNQCMQSNISSIQGYILEQDSQNDSDKRIELMTTLHYLSQFVASCIRKEDCNG